MLYLDRRFRLGRGNVMALYVMGYTLGRVWIEALRSDHANHILGLRLNIWTSIIVFVLALAWFLRHGGFHAERESTPYTRRRRSPTGDGGGSADVGSDEGLVDISDLPDAGDPSPAPRCLAAAGCGPPSSG